MEKIVTQVFGSGADPKAVAEAAVRTWDQIARELSPIIGEAGFRALYARALHLTTSIYPWLAATEQQHQSSGPFTDLRAGLQRCNYTGAVDASNALLVTFTELLATLIGEALTTRILHSVRANDGPQACTGD